MADFLEFTYLLLKNNNSKFTRSAKRLRVRAKSVVASLATYLLARAFCFASKVVGTLELFLHKVAI